MIGNRLRYLIPVLFLMMGACAPQVQKDYSKFYSERPHSILIVPVVNNTVDIDAPNYFLATVTVPLAERGYYTFPVNLVRGVMNEEGLSDANLVHAADPTVLGAMFGADSILYISIEHWETVYIVISATTTVSFKYVLKSGRTGETLWVDQSTVQYTPNGGGGGGIGGLVAMAVQAAIQKAAPNYMPLAKQANAMALWTPGKGLPSGPYHGQFGADSAAYPGTGAGSNLAAVTAPPQKTTVPSPAVPASAAMTSTGNVCAPGMHIDTVVDRGRIQQGIRDYAEIVGIGSPYPAREIKSFQKIEITRDNCGDGVVRVTMTTVEPYRGGREPTREHEFLVTKNDKGLKVSGCKTC